MAADSVHQSLQDQAEHQHFHCCGCTQIAATLTIGALITYLLYTRSQTARYYIRMVTFYISIFLSGVLSMFGSFPTYFFNAGAAIAMICMRFTCLWLDLEVEVRGAEKIAKASGQEYKPLVLISNHQSSLDLYVMAYAWPAKCASMMKSSLKFIPFFNLSAIFSNSIFINRTDKESAHKACLEAVDTMQKKQLKIWVFPEGTRNHKHGMLPFKKGAFNIAVQAQIPIVPIVVSDYRPFYSKMQKYFHNKGRIIAQVMDPIPTKGLKYEDVSRLCEQVREDMLKVYEEISIEAEKRFRSAIGSPIDDKNSQQLVAESNNNKKSE